MIQIAILGYGTVGSGVAEAIFTNGGLINQRLGEELKIKYVLDLRDFPGSPVEDILVHDFETVVNDPDVSIVVEVMGGIEPARTFTQRCLMAGKSVVTSNKALVAKHGAALLNTARENRVSYLYEASVGGGIPIIRTISEALTGDRIEEITGILNGTTNYVLSRMYDEGAGYGEALMQAQQKGYAEQNPEADVRGYDACRKIAILTSVISGKSADYEEIYTEGITDVTAADIAYAKALGMKIKLLASCKRDGDRYFAIVAPHLLGKDHPLYNVDDVFNAIFIRGNILGDAMFYGSGAGKLPTASAVVGDVICAAKNPGRSMMPVWTDEKVVPEDKSETVKRYFVRVKADKSADKSRAEEAVREAFGRVSTVKADGIEGEFGFLTEVMSEADYEKAAAKVSGIIRMIRVMY